jgi:predicted GNAT superfamily acetyltransferase
MSGVGQPDADSRDMPAAARDVADAADKAADAARVRIRELTVMSDLDTTRRLFDEIWHPEPGNPPATTELMRALAKVGSYVAGAFDDGAGGGRLVGACVGFFGPPAGEVLHSHIAGVSAAASGRGVGYALKLHQRAWALRRDVRQITWTFDPLVRRNAYFNLVKLGARPAEYLIDFYGGMHDAINGDGDTDRLLVRWDLRSPGVAAARTAKLTPASAPAERERGAQDVLSAAADGWPLSRPAAAIPGGRPLLVAVPPDIEALRVSDPACAAAWRSALREVLAPVMATGGRITGFDKSGWYVVESEEETP